MGRIGNAKDCGGLVFTNTRLMNGCLLAKWIIILERGMMICVAIN
jgi:hypothetical protein